MIQSRKKCITLDLPEAKIDSINFRYNYFTKDERTNDSGIAQIKENSQSVFSETLLKREVPRFIKLEFSLQDFDQGDLSLSFGSGANRVNFQPFRYERLYTDNPVSISNNREFIQNENDVNSVYDESLNYKDSTLRERLKCK